MNIDAMSADQKTGPLHDAEHDGNDPAATPVVIEPTEIEWTDNLVELLDLHCSIRRDLDHIRWSIAEHIEVIYEQEAWVRSANEECLLKVEHIDKHYMCRSAVSTEGKEGKLDKGRDELDELYTGLERYEDKASHYT